MMHLFRDGLLPATIISHRTSVASVLRHWVYDPAAELHIKRFIRAFRLEGPVQRRIMPKWDLHLVLSSLLKLPFASECDIQGEFSDDVIPLKWQTMKTVFLLALASARRRSYLHALSVSAGRCVLSRGATQRQLVVSLLPEPGFLAKNQLPSQVPEWISVPGIAHLNPSEAERMLCPVRQLTLHTGLGKNLGGPSADVCSLESQHQGYHEKSHQPMDRGDCQGSLHSSWSRVIYDQVTAHEVSFMGVQLSGSPTWHPVSGVLEVFWGLPEFISTGHGLYRWWHVYTGSSGGRTASCGSRTSSPSSIAYTICMQPCYDILNEDYLIISMEWSSSGQEPAEKRLLGKNLVNDRRILNPPQVWLRMETGMWLNFIVLKFRLGSASVPNVCSHCYSVPSEMCSERDSPLNRLYQRTHAKLARLAGSGQLGLSRWLRSLAASSRKLLFTLGGLRDRARHPRQYFRWPRRAKRSRPITHEWIDPWTLLLPGQHRWAPQMSRASSGWPGAGKTKGSRGLSLSLHISGSIHEETS